MKTINEIYLEKRLKVVLPNGGIFAVTQRLVATLSKNFESLGYVLSPRLFTALSKLNESQLTDFYVSTFPVLKKMRGAHRVFSPMYPNFPQQIISMSQFELYMNAMVHYWSFWAKDVGLTDETWLPEYEKIERMPLTEPTKQDMIDLGNEEDFKSIFTTLVLSKSSTSISDKEVVEWFVSVYKDRLARILPDQIPSKEQLALVAGLLLKVGSSGECMVKYVKTPTDVLRVASAFAGGDVSLAEVVKFKKFSRPQRRFLMDLLESCKTDFFTTIAEEMAKYQSRWIRLGEVIHPGEYASTHRRAFAAFNTIRSDKKICTFNSRVESALKEDQVAEAVRILVTRPGEFARRLDHIFRTDSLLRANVVKKFLGVADKVSTNVLLQLFTHFKTRGEIEFRAVFPKGNLAKIHVLEESIMPIDRKFCLDFSEKIRTVLVKRFSTLDQMGRVYLDEKLKSYLIPFSQRSAAKALKTIVRGSQLPLDGDYDTIRFFIWWMNMDAGKTNRGWSSGTRVDLDLTATILNDKWEYLNDIAYYNLKDFEGHHSGDITDAPHGAAEFIDISMSKVLQRGGRYIVMGVYSYSQQPYCDLPECFAGWMGRTSPNSGEIFEAKTVKNKIDVSSDTQVCLPLIIDCQERKVIWMDLSLKQRPTWNNARNNSNNIGLVCRAMAELRKPTLYDLLSMHVSGRGKLVTCPNDADVVFSSEDFPYDTDTILTKYV